MTLCKQKLFFIIGLWALIWIAYCNSLTASWHLDDISNIVRNEKIHLGQIDSDSLTDALFAGTTGKIYRPVPMVSFALNWYFGGVDVVGYHIVNIVIHCINGFLLYLVIVQLLRTPRLSGIYTESEVYWAAFLASIFWALNPVQTQAVTYIVQRMASMAGMFYLFGIYLFLRYKTTTSAGLRISLVAAIVSSYLLAIFSKENAALFPLSLFLIQVIFFSSDQPRRLRNRDWILPGALVSFTMIVGVGFFLIIRDNPLQFVENLYANRPFTVSQRLLTEPRVLLFYLSQLFFPVPARLSLSHDIVLSTSLIEPWTTLPALLAVFSIVLLSIASYRKKPLVSFAGLFFFLNHGVESTILPLELVFEHRNYLPSFFLFLPLALAIVRWSHHRYFSTRYRRYLAVGVLCISIFLLCNWTFARNLAWHSEKSLWEDEITKNPSLARPYHNLAWGYYQARGQYEEALRLYEKALTLKYHSAFELAITLGNVGRVHYIMGDYDEALHYFSKSIQKHPQPQIVEYQMVMVMIQQNRLKEALHKIDTGLHSNDQDPMHLKLKGIILSKINDDDGAASFLYRSLTRDPEKLDTRAHLGVALSRLGRFDEATSILGNQNLIASDNAQVLMALSEIGRAKGDLEKSDEYFYRLVAHQGVGKVKNILLSWKTDNLSIDIDHDHYMSRLNLVQH
jgi:tetratricopeptide (TPR) repeat protein